MPRFRLYSDRLKDAEKAGTTEVYQYESIPKKTRVQVRHLILAAFGDNERWDRSEGNQKNRAALRVRDTYCHEMGSDHLGYLPEDPLGDLAIFLENGHTEQFLDILEVCCVILEGVVKKSYNYGSTWNVRLSADQAIEDINFRLRDGGVGFQFTNGQLIRVDSQFAHAEIIKPAFTLLNRPGFEGPQSEFLNAHEHYRSGRNKEAITEAAKAFESLMKAICDQKGWEYNRGARASDLLKVLRQHNLWPAYLDGSFDHLIATLASGLPQVRNEEGAHGQGATKREVPDFVAAYALHLAAAKMVLISSAAADVD